MAETTCFVCRRLTCLTRTDIFSKPRFANVWRTNHETCLKRTTIQGKNRTFWLLSSFDNHATSVSILGGKRCLVGCQISASVNFKLRSSNNNGFLLRESNAIERLPRNSGHHIRDGRCRILVCFWSCQETRRGLEWFDVPKKYCLTLTFFIILMSRAGWMKCLPQNYYLHRLN